MKIKKYLLVTLTQESDNVIFSKFNGLTNIDLPQAEEIVRNRLEFSEGKDHYLIIDLTNVKQVSYSAKKYMYKKDKGLKNILGGAFIASNPISILFANVFVKIKSEVPSRFFLNKEDALKWIKELSSNTVK